jgi:Ca2+/Na+ antiporter
MNPTSLIGMALIGLLGVYLFLSFSNEQNAEQRLDKAKHEQQTKEFDRDFARAMNGQEIKAPAQAELDAAKKRVAELEAEKARREAEEKQRLAAMQTELDQMAGYNKNTKDKK